MMKFNRYIILLIAVVALLAVYAYSMMNSLAMLTSDYWTILSPLIIVLLTLVVLVTSKAHYTRFAQFWFFWILWVLFEVLIGKTGSEKGNVFRMLLAPMAFLFFFVLSQKSHISQKQLIGALVTLFLFTFYWSVTNSLAVTKEYDFLQTNYVYWPICCAPAIFMVHNKKFRWLLIGCVLVGIVISMKRSAVIIAFLVLVFAFLTRGRNFKQASYVMVLLFIGYFFFNSYFSDNLLAIQDRMSVIISDEGSGRLPIYQTVWTSITSFNAGEILVGRGFGTITQTGFSNAHNDFLQVLYEYGIIGVVFYILLIFRAVKQLQIINKNLDYERSVVIAEGTSLIVLVVLGLVSNIVVSYTFFVFICCFWGFIEGGYIYVSQSKAFYESGNRI